MADNKSRWFTAFRPRKLGGDAWMGAEEDMKELHENWAPWKEGTYFVETEEWEEDGWTVRRTRRVDENGNPTEA